jgi:hypothetical protein
MRGVETKDSKLIVAEVPFIKFALNFFVTVILICYRLSHIFELCYISTDLLFVVAYSSALCPHLFGRTTYL